MQIFAFFALALTWLKSIPLTQAQSICGPPNATAVITVTETQREQAGISSTLVDSVTSALQLESSKWANGSVVDEEFYEPPVGTADAAAGTLLKLQLDANTSAYTLPPNTALSRFIFQTETLNGTRVPASAYILWPYLPRTQRNGSGYSVIGWAHGATGGFGNCAPSHIRDLSADFLAPFTLVLQGYVVVAPDYAGLGVEKDAKGREIIHQFLANPSHANDLFYSVQAAQSAFKILSKQFVIVGLSQGGGAAWGAAQRQALVPVEGYLGSVAVAPLTNFLDVGGAANTPIALIARAILSVFPEFDLNSVLTPNGIKLLTLFSTIRGCSVAGASLLIDPDFLRPDILQNPYLQEYQNLTGNGGRPIGGPLLVIHGEADNVIPFSSTAIAVDRTCKVDPSARLEFAAFANATHDPVMYASQRVWLNWIEDRFAGVPTSVGCHRTNYSSARPYRFYQTEGNWFIELTREFAQTV